MKDYNLIHNIQKPSQLMPTDKIVLTLIQQLLKRKKSHIEIANLLIESNEPFIDRHYKSKFLSRVAYFIQLSIDIESSRPKPKSTSKKM
jgi:hypothetical protein